MPPWTERQLSALGDELGLTVGVSAAPPQGEGDDLRAFVQQGRHGTMDWLARDLDRRADPRAHVPGACSVVSLAEPCHPGPRAAPLPDRPTGLVARYALGRDYHRTLLGKVRRFARALGPSARPYVDTGPVMEKVRAARSGLGWIGKHTNCVSRSHGSWWMLGSVITPQELPPGEPHKDACGSCDRCLRACPTGAIDPAAPYRMDARLCISYLTIELRGPIPVELRPAMGTWIFGCDLCLDVCPFNRFAQAARDLRYEPRLPWEQPDLIAMLAWDEVTWDEATRGSAIRRAKRAGLLRNVAVALGNAGDRAAVPALETCLQAEPEALVRGHAAWALGRLGGVPAHGALLRACSDPDPWVQQEARAALAGVSP